FCGQLIEAKRARRLEQTIIRTICVESPQRLHVAPATADLAALAPSQLRALGLHAGRGASLVRLCRTIELERLHDVETDVVAAPLERERGLGPWSIGVVCLEGLGRYDYGLVGDLGLIKLLRTLRGRPVEGWETAERPGGGVGDGGAARAVRRVGRHREHVFARRLFARSARRVTSAHGAHRDH